MENVLIIDDNVKFAEDLELLLKGSYKIFRAENSFKGIEILKRNHISAVLLDLQLPDIPGLDMLEKIHNDFDALLPVIIITEYDDTEYVVKAMRLGAFDFLSKDFHVDLMKEKIEQALQQKNLKLRVDGLQNNASVTDDTFIFACDEMKNINFEISKLANWDFDVLLVGETGVGKDMVASQIYQRSNRKDKPFIPIPLRSLSESVLESELFGHEKGAFTGADRMKIGKFEAANKGIIYLPEISNLPEAIQLKLLHFMQYKTITRVGHDSRKGELNLDVRLIMATNENLEDLVKNGRMREDFYYRILGVTLKVPPLRDRVEDVIPLSNYFLSKYSAQYNQHNYKFSDEVLEAFRNYEWKGNIRELSNSIKNALSYTNSDVLELKDFPNIVRNKGGKNIEPVFSEDSLEDFLFYKDFETKNKINYFTALLKKVDGKVSLAAKLSGLTTQGFRKIMKQLNID
ncbi:MAG: sigma-54 dependent transcriptional regulator [Ignavibacteriae bacterium]|nr:sigma-54 dependent transcriptional regulator [Ignavibacteriota bacterium]